MDFLQEIHTRLTSATVQAAIFKPAPSSSPGLDLISPGLLRLTWPSPLGQLMILYTVTTSIGRGFIPPDWKRALIYPLPKNKPGDYRPISLLSQLSKLCERLVSWMLTEDIPLSPAQFGGRGLLSAIDAARLAHHSSVQADATDNFLVAALLDISKAYDRVVPAILIQDLLARSTSPLLCRWIQQWLTNRSIQVRMDQALSPRNTSTVESPKAPRSR